MHILFKYASRSRPERFFAGLDSIVDNLEDKTNFTILCTLDSDDYTMNTSEIKQRIMSYPNIAAVYATSESKIHAINRDMQSIEAWPWNILVVMSDDMRFIRYGFDRTIREGFSINCPDLDGFLHYPDQDTGLAISTMTIEGRPYYNRWGYIYHPAYKSLWADNEEMDKARMLGRYHYMGERIFNHLNPAYGHLPRDPLFDHQQNFWNADEAIYYARKQNNFDLIETKTA